MFIRRHLPLALLLVVSAVACDAGPSAFDRSARAGGEDTLGAAPAADTADFRSADSVDVSGGAERPGTDPGADAAPMDEVPDGGPEAPARFAGAGVPTPRTSQPPPPVERIDFSLPPAGQRLVFERPEHVRGIYLNAWASGSARRTAALMALADTTEINSFVIDIKDATGYVSHASQVPLARAIGATGEIRIRDLPGLLRRLHERGIYPIARIVIVKDPLLAAARPSWAIQDTAGGVWKDSKGFVWMNMWDRRVWEYHVDLAKEVAAMGFPEIQWDYVRFPDASRADLDRAVYAGSEGRPRTEAIRSFLKYSREELQPMGVQVTADVFGVTTSTYRDVGIGQVWESFIDQVDVALPMIYPSHYWRGSFGIERPNHHPYEIIREALAGAVQRSKLIEGAGTTRPWLQDFTLGQPRYGAPEVRAQIQATYDMGIYEWILWNPSSRYTEGALEPVGGFKTDPLIRLANRVIPVSRKAAVLDSVAKARAAAATPAPPADTGKVTRPAPRDTTGAVRDTVVADTVPSKPPVLDSIAMPDSLKPVVDTLPPDTVVVARPGGGEGSRH